MSDLIKDEVEVFSDLEALSRAAAERLVQLARTAVTERGRFDLVLAGGSTPRRLYELLAGEYGDNIAWHQVHLFWGDERCVPPDRPQSNFKLAQETLISRVPLPAENVHRIPAELEPPREAAAAYERLLRSHWPQAAWPAFDLVLLGLGADGHTASLFPGDPVLEEQESWVRAVLAPPAYEIRQRITLTFLAINSARAIYFLVSGEVKVPALHAVLEQNGSALPASRVRPAEGEPRWFLDEAAAERLQRAQGGR